MKTAAQAFLSLSSEQWGAPCPSPYDVEPRGYARRVSPTPTARGRGLEGEAPSGLANAASGAPELRGQRVINLIVAHIEARQRCAVPQGCAESFVLGMGCCDCGLCGNDGSRYRVCGTQEGC